MEATLLIGSLCLGVFGVAVGLIIYLWHQKSKAALTEALAQAQTQLKAQCERGSALESMLEEMRAQNATLNLELKEKHTRLEVIEQSYEARLADLQRASVAALEAEKVRAQGLLDELKAQFAQHSQERAREQERLEKSSREELQNAFKALSADILRQNTQSFKEEQTLSLQPLREQIESFAKQLMLNHQSSSTQNTELKTQIQMLHTLNSELSLEAKRLTNALKGENKTQGNWGEVILQKVLEGSGLAEGREYELQSSVRDDNERTLRPDAIIRLPKSGGQERCVVVDSKTSLVAYERLCNTSDPLEAQKAQKELAQSIQTHFQNLGAKNYQQFLDGAKLDFVLMFVPIEGAFIEAMRADSGLYEHAYSKGVVLVSPSTIMAVLRIIQNLWQFEYRNTNMERVFDEINVLFERINRFEGELEKLGKNIGTMNKTYDDVMTKYKGRQGIAHKRGEIKKLLGGIESIAQESEAQDELEAEEGGE